MGQEQRRQDQLGDYCDGQAIGDAGNMNQNDSHGIGAKMSDSGRTLGKVPVGLLMDQP